MPADKITVPIPRTYQLPPEGGHQAVCVDIVDFGEVPNQRYGTIEHRVAFVFQLNELNDAGYRFEVATRFNLAMGEKALLRKFLEQLRGRPYKREELQKAPELHLLEGVNAIVTIVHATRGDRTYANVHAIRPVGKRGITKAVLARAKEGDLAAARLVLDRVLGINAVADWPSRGHVEESARFDEMLGLTR